MTTAGSSDRKGDGGKAKAVPALWPSQKWVPSSCNSCRSTAPLILRHLRFSEADPHLSEKVAKLKSLKSSGEDKCGRCVIWDTLESASFSTWKRGVTEMRTGWK